MNIYIHGPQGCGLTSHAENFKRVFRMERVHDNGQDPFQSGHTMALHGNLVLITTDRLKDQNGGAVPTSIPGFLTVLTYEEALNYLNTDAEDGS